MSGGGTLTHNTISVTTSATPIVAGSTARDSLLIVNNGAVTVYVGGSAVSTSTGVPIPSNGSLTFEGDYSGPLYGIVASGTCDVRYLNVT